MVLCIFLFFSIIQPVSAELIFIDNYTASEDLYIKGLFGDVANNYVYANTWADGLFAFGYTDDTITFLDNVSLNGIGWGVWVDENGYIYSARQDSGFYIHSFDGNELTEITSHASFHTYGVWGYDTYIFSSGDDGIHAFSFDGTELQHIDTYSLEGENPYFIWADESYIYITSGTEYIHAFSFDGETLTLVDTLTTENGVFGQIGSNDYIFAALGGNGFYVYDFDGTDISYLDSECSGRDAYYGLHYSNGFINVGKSTEGFSVYTFNNDSISISDSADNESYGVWSDGDYVFYGGTNEMGMYNNTEATVETSLDEQEYSVGGGGELQNKDYDGDGLSNKEEELYGTNPYDTDTDNDGWSDFEEIMYGSDPLDFTDYPGKTKECCCGFFLILIGLLCLVILFLIKNLK